MPLSVRPLKGSSWQLCTDCYTRRFIDRQCRKDKKSATILNRTTRLDSSQMCELTERRKTLGNGRPGSRVELSEIENGLLVQQKSAHRDSKSNYQYEVLTKQLANSYRQGKIASKSRSSLLDLIKSVGSNLSALVRNY